MKRKVFIATGVLALAGGLATATLSSSCDTVCTTEARPSVTLRVMTQDGSALTPANVSQVWYRVSEDPAMRSEIGPPPDSPDPEFNLKNPPTGWEIAECADDACTQWVLGYETTGYYEIKAWACDGVHEATTAVHLTDDGCHADTEELEILVDAAECAPEPGPAIGTPPDCTLESRPSMILEMVDPKKGTEFTVTAESVYAYVDDESTPIMGECLNEACSIWAIGRERPGKYTVHAEVCDKSTTMEIEVPMTPDGCHVDTRFDLMEVDASSCPMPLKDAPPKGESPQVAPPPGGANCDMMAHPSAMVFVAQDHGDVWSPVKVDSVWYEYDDTRHKAGCLDNDCTLGTYIVGWEQEGRFKAHTEVCGKQFSTEFSVGRTDDGCHVRTQFVPLLVDQTQCLGR